jgi:hypothetical protein
MSVLLRNQRQAKPLDVYIAESADRAARQDLPTIDAAGSINFRPTPTPELGGGPALRITLGRRASHLDRRIYLDLRNGFIEASGATGRNLRRTSETVSSRLRGRLDEI